MNLLFDTSVWVDHLRRGDLVDVLPKIRGRYLLWMDAVCAAELLAGCRTKPERRAVSALTAPFERAGRLAVPLAGDFVRAAVAISELRARGRTLAKPAGALLDGLIAATAIRIGALLVTSNLRDFESLRRRMPLQLESVAELCARL